MTKKRDIWRPNGTCILVDEKKTAYQFVCNGSLVLLREMSHGCTREVRQKPMQRETWQRIKQGRCVFYGTAEQGNDVYGQLNATLPPPYGVGCGAAPHREPSVGDRAGVTCPPGSAGLHGGGRRLELSLLLPAKFGELFASDSGRPYKFCLGRVSVTLENQSNEPAKRLSKQQADALITPSSASVFSDVKLVLGVMTPTYACDVRNVHRATWMTHSRVCALSRHAEAGCSVMPAFVFANVSREVVERADDVVLLQDVVPASRLNSGYAIWWNLGKTREMWREGQYKTLAWFRHALRFPWATHIAKMDLDTYPFVTAIYNDLRSLPPTRVFYGRQFDVWRGGMYGEFYLVTKDVAARWVDRENATRSTRFQQFERQAEDQTFATIMRMGVYTHWFSVNGCPGRWLHMR